MPHCHAAGDRPQSSLTLAPPTVKGAYFSLSTVNLNRAKSKRYRQLQQRIAEAWFRHIFLPVFKNSGSLKTTCQSRRFRNEQLSFSPAAGYVPENVYITNPSDFFLTILANICGVESFRKRLKRLRATLSGEIQSPCSNSVCRTLSPFPPNSAILRMSW